MTHLYDIALDPALLRDEAAALQREWLITNGLGGYASSSVAGANTRRYHGLLVAALDPPVGRAVLLSKLEESLEIVDADGARSPTFALSMNLYPGVTYPQGNQFLETWTSLPAPTWIWSPMPGVRFEKRVWMAQGHNAVYVAYRLLEAPKGSTAHLHLAPLLAWKDYHSEMRSTDHVADATWFSPDPQVARERDAPAGVLRIVLPGILNQSSRPCTLDLHILTESGDPQQDATFAGQPYWYYSFIHPREQERGLDFKEDLFTLGILSVPLSVAETIIVQASVQKTADNAPTAQATSLPLPAPQAAWEQLAASQKEQAELVQMVDSFAQKLSLAAGQFLVQAPGGRSTVIAGYHWFADWGRDTMIALPGLCLPTGHADLAREILVSYSRFVDQGMLPNRFPDAGAQPEYNTVDATLWYFVAIYRYYIATDDLALIRDTLWPVLERIILGHQRGTRYNIHIDSDSLLYAGQPGVQLTWMDAKIGDWVVTPRTGKPVEINALWHNALRTMAFFATLLNNAEAVDRYETLAETHAGLFRARFPRLDGHGLYDVLDTPDRNAPDESVRPNQIFAVSLPFPSIDPASPIARTIVRVVQDELYTPFGLRTLSPRHPSYRPYYGGSPTERDSAYHQGTAWPWLLGAFAEAHYRVFKDREAAMDLLRGMEAQMTELGIGTLAEIYDGGEARPGAPLQRPRGCIAQAWSVGEILRVWKDLDTSRRKQ